MSDKVGLTRKSDRRLRLMVGLQVFWITLIFVLGLWWGKLILRQAELISDLEEKLGIAGTTAIQSSSRTQRMLQGEFGTFFLLVLGVTGLMVWLYWRDTKRSKAVQAFFAAFSHELRTPLTSIRLQAESISEGVPRDSSLASQAHRLLEDTNRLESQVEKTLELARLEGGGPLFTQPIQLESLLEKFVKNARDRSSVPVTFKLKLEPQTILGDITAIQTILKNLLENSIKHSATSPLSISIESFFKDNRVQVIFQDSGNGFRGDVQSLGKIFEKGPESPGAGIGLYLIRTLMERMGGKAFFLTSNTAKGFQTVLFFEKGDSHGPV